MNRICLSISFFYLSIYTNMRLKRRRYTTVGKCDKSRSLGTIQQKRLTCKALSAKEHGLFPPKSFIVLHDNIALSSLGARGREQAAHQRGPPFERAAARRNSPKLLHATRGSSCACRILEVWCISS